MHATATAANLPTAAPSVEPPARRVRCGCCGGDGECWDRGDAATGVPAGFGPCPQCDGEGTVVPRALVVAPAVLDDIAF